MRKYFGNGVILVLIILLVLAYVGDNMHRYFFDTLDFVRDHSNSIDLTQTEKDWLKNTDRIIYAADRNAPPLRFVDQSDGQYKGVVVDYINQLSLEIGTQIDVMPLLWEDALSQLSQGNTDICDMFSSEERAENFIFTKPIYNLRAVLAVKTEENDKINIKDLGNMTIATQRGDYINYYFEKEHPNVKLVHVPDVASAYNLLVDDQVDAIAGDEPVVSYIINNVNKPSIKIIDAPLYEKEVVLALPKSHTILLSILNKGIDSINRKNQLEKIQQKWFGISAPIVTPLKIQKIISYFVLLILPIFIALIIILAINKSLKSKVNKRAKELAESKYELETIFEGITDYMIVINKDYTVSNINTSFLSFLNIEKDAIIGSSCRELLKEFCKDYGRWFALEVFSEELFRPHETLYREKLYKVNYYPLRNENKSFGKLLIVLKDITNEKINERHLFQANKMSAIGELASGVAHEIRNRLGLIRTHSFILSSNPRIFPEMKESLSYIDNAVDRASKIIDNLLNFSKISGDAKERTNIKNFVANIASLEYKNMQKNNIDIHIHGKENLEIYINQEALKHIILNLISNAIDAMEKVSHAAVLVIHIIEKTGYIDLEFIDNGCGVSDENKEKLFNPFFTTKPPQKGTGLGLYIVYKEVEKLNGKIEVVSKVNKGTKFTISIPIGA